MSSVLIALRRLREDRVHAIGLSVLILVTATVFGVAPRLADQVADDALRGVVSETSAFGRNITLLEERVLAADPAEPLKGVEKEGDRLGDRMPASIRALVSERRVVIDSARFRVEAKTQEPTFFRFRIQPGAEQRVTYAAGRAPIGGIRRIDLPDDLRSLLPQLDPASTERVEVVHLETAVAADALRQSGLTLGQRLFLSVDGGDPLAGRRPGVVAVDIVGVIAARDPADPFWHEDPFLDEVSRRWIGGDTRYLDVGALLPVDAYPSLTALGTQFGLPIRYAWRHFVDPDRLAASRLGATILDLRRLETTFPTTQVANAALDHVAMRSGLLPLLVGHAERWASASALLTVIAIGPAAVAFAALGLVAMMAARRRRPALALVRGRGATLGQIVRAVFLEGFVVAVPALGAAILLASILVPAGSTRGTIIAATLVAAVAVGLLIATALRGTLGLASAARAARDDDPSPRGVSARRLILDLVVILGAAGGAYLLRERGVRGATGAATLPGADPLIAAVPALAGIAAGLAAIRLVPIPLRILARIAGRARGLVPILAIRRAIHGGTTAAVLVVLLATASIGTFSAAALGHLERSGTAAAWQEIGAPFRVTAAVGSLPAALEPHELPGVTASAGLFRTLVPVGSRNLRITFAAVDLAAYQQIVAGSPVDPATPPEMLAARPPDGVVPLLVSPSLVTRTDGIRMGETVEIVVEGYHYRVRPIATRASFPTIAADATFAVASRQQLKAIHPEAPLSPTSQLLAAPDGDGAAIREAVAPVALGATVASRSEFARSFSDSPVTAAIAAGIAIAAIVAALYAALAVTAALALAGAARSTEVAHLRMIGMSRRDALGLAIVEHGPTVLLAFVAGVALGLGLFVLLQPGLGLDALVGARLPVPIATDPRQLAVILGGVLAIAGVGIGLAAWMQRRGVAVAA
ncbi:MAG TPA: ABC transporter permease, partial [Candidatus Limnocylindrales bacterium]|nr:ABC transporter permease [Candidatus Limnocylindrales bacterium]